MPESNFLHQRTFLMVLEHLKLLPNLLKILFPHISLFIKLKITIQENSKILCLFYHFNSFNSAGRFPTFFMSSLLFSNKHHKRLIFIQFHFIELAPFINMFDCFNQSNSRFSNDRNIISITKHINSWQII